jgi:hypothetical protein
MLAFEPLCALTVLVWNYGYEQTLKWIAEKCGIVFSEKIIKKYCSMDIKREKKRKYIQDNQKQLNFNKNEVKKSRLDKIRTYNEDKINTFHTYGKNNPEKKIFGIIWLLLQA